MNLCRLSSQELFLLFFSEPSLDFSYEEQEGVFGKSGSVIFECLSHFFVFLVALHPLAVLEE